MTSNDLVGIGVFLAYYLGVFGVSGLMIALWHAAPTEIVRKAEHLGAAASIFLLLHLFSSPFGALGAIVALGALAVPALRMMERAPWYRRIFAERDPQGGEVRRQIVYLQISFALLVVIFWGVLGHEWRHLAAVAVMIWGFGDAAAALVGKAWGRRHVFSPMVENVKTYEGTAAMIAVAAMASFLTLVLYAGYPIGSSLLVTLVVAPVAGMVELVSHRGTDTILVPLASGLVILALLLSLPVLGR